ncbi:UbiD family decarboxylase [Paenibacillus arenosi]|uniref:UbiD family decarboxylase n=1 Tax=Paenibacillus arenosi TaxID=2774142 RepID=A0ABR9B1X6_9BACL|nr:UbiD family decarboxylase [Paenibacillus arenosi]MBD8499445.1 UbiD family decarboxylase [Paenibacillus arenosi]
MVDRENILSEISNSLKSLADRHLKPFDKNLLVCAYITKALALYDIKPIVVGGHSVEIYTNGRYTTVDIDFVFNGRDIAIDVLARLGFIQAESKRHYYIEALAVPIEIPDNHLAGSLDKVIKVDINDDLYVYCIGIEDLLLDRLRAALYWKSESSKEWAIQLFELNKEIVDISYLIVTAQQEDTDLLHLVEALIKGGYLK